MNVKTTVAVAVFSAVTGFVTLAAAAPGNPGHGPAPARAQCDVAGYYAGLGDAMNLSDKAKGAWDKYVKLRTDQCEQHRVWHDKNFAKAPESREAAMKLQAEHMKLRADMLEKKAAARAELDKSLTPEQQQMLDAYEPGAGSRMAGPAPRQHGGRGHRFGPGHGYGPGCSSMGPGYSSGYGPGCGGMRPDCAWRFNGYYRMPDRGGCWW